MSANWPRMRGMFGSPNKASEYALEVREENPPGFWTSRASSCALDNTVLLRGVSITPRSSPKAEPEVTVVGMMRSPRLMPFTTISPRFSDDPTGAATVFVGSLVACACAEWWTLTTAQDRTAQPPTH